MSTSEKMTQEQKERRLIEDAKHADRWEFVTTVPPSDGDDSDE